MEIFTPRLKNHPCWSSCITYGKLVIRTKISSYFCLGCGSGSLSSDRTPPMSLMDGISRDRSSRSSGKTAGWDWAIIAPRLPGSLGRSIVFIYSLKSTHASVSIMFIRQNKVAITLRIVYLGFNFRLTFLASFENTSMYSSATFKRAAYTN